MQFALSSIVRRNVRKHFHVLFHAWNKVRSTDRSQFSGLAPALAAVFYRCREIEPGVWRVCIRNTGSAAMEFNVRLGELPTPKAGNPRVFLPAGRRVSLTLHIPRPNPLPIAAAFVCVYATSIRTIGREVRECRFSRQSAELLSA